MKDTPKKRKQIYAMVLAMSIAISGIPGYAQNEEQNRTVQPIPVTAAWEDGEIEKIYDGSNMISTVIRPKLSIADGSSDELPKELTVMNTEISFTMDGKDAGVRKAVTNEPLVLSDSKFVLTNPTPEINVKVLPIKLDETDLDIGDNRGKSYDANSKAVINVQLKNSGKIVKGEFDSLSLAYEANYWNGEREEIGIPSGNTLADNILISKVKIFQGTTESNNYYFEEDIRILMEGPYEITCNESFLKFMEMESLGTAVEEKRNDSDSIEIHWFREPTQILKAGLRFSEEPEAAIWAESFLVDNAEPTTLYAKKSSGEISRPIFVAADTKRPQGTIYAKVEEQGDVSITQLRDEFDLLSDGQKITLVLEGIDEESKISKIEWVGSDKALLDGWEEPKEAYVLTPEEEMALKKAWEEWKGPVHVIHVNEGEQKQSHVVPIELEAISEKEELKRFYYAKITDFAGNVSYITSSGVLQDISAPMVRMQLAKEEGVFLETQRKVYSGDIGFTLNLSDPGISSGISEVEVTLKDYIGNIVAIHSTKDATIWTSLEKVAAMESLRKAVAPTEQQIQCANQGVLEGVFQELPDGNYTIRVIAKDRVGHESQVLEECFIKDSTEPEIILENELTFRGNERDDEQFYTGGRWIVTVRDLTLEKPVDCLMNGTEEAGSAWQEEIEAATGCISRRMILEFGKNRNHQEGQYSFEIFAKDVLGNEAKKESGAFLIDYTAPTYRVEFSEVDERSDRRDVNKRYYNNAIVARFGIDEETAYKDTLLKIVVKNSGGEEVIKWEDGKILVKNEHFLFQHEENTKQFQVTILEVPENNDDGYTFHVEGKDQSGNPLTVNWTDGKDYTAELQMVRALDVTAPVLERIVYDTEKSFQTVEGKDYVDKETTLTFMIKEHHPITNKSFVTSDRIEKDCFWKELQKDVYQTKLHVPMNGLGDVQQVSLEIIDKAGNPAVLANDDQGNAIPLRSRKNTTFNQGKFTDRFTVDTVLPKIQLEYVDYNPNRKGIRGIDYFNHPITVKVTVDEHNFSESLLNIPVVLGNKEGNYSESEWKTTGDIHVKNFTFAADNQYDLTITGTDSAGNGFAAPKHDEKMTVVAADGSIGVKVAIDRTIPSYGDTAKPAIVILPKEESGKTVDGQELYATDVTYEVIVYDPLNPTENGYASGIEHIRFTAKGEDGTIAECIVDRKGTIVSEDGMVVKMVTGTATTLAKGEQEKYVFQVTVRKEIFNTNGICLTVSAEDLSTNKIEKSGTQIAIDMTKPKITVSYDNENVSNGKYFRDVRTATIRIMERNMDAGCLQFLVNGSNKHLKLKQVGGGTGNGDDAEWIGTYIFSADDDYQIEVICEDLAGNAGQVEYLGEAPQVFTIDTKKPVIEIQFDNNREFHEKYYDAPRIATITVIERNFDGKNVEITGKATEAGAAVNYPTISNWVSFGETNCATLRFAEDAHYTFDVSCTDLAMNESENMEEKGFVIDTKDPELTITGVENHRHYARQVLPKIDFSDNNYDRYEVEFIRAERELPVVDVKEKLCGSVAVFVDENGRGVGSKQIDDVEHLEENDGIYTLRVVVYDKAGRSTEKTVVYSVNRFGTVYVYSDDLSSLRNGYHQSVSGALYVKAFNANALLKDSVKIEITCDGATLEDQESYAEVETAMQSNKGEWFEYQFNLSNKDFKEDGHYTITISDKDEAGNTKTNRDDQIEFYVDQTKPMIDSVIGLEKARVRSNELQVDYTVSDAIALNCVQVYVNDELVNQILEFEDRNIAKGTFTIGAGMNQKVRFVIEDKAGNILDTADETFDSPYPFHSNLTVSGNLFVLWYANKPLFWGSVLSVALLTGSGFVFLVMKKRKKQEAEG